MALDERSLFSSHVAMVDHFVSYGTVDDDASRIMVDAIETHRVKDRISQMRTESQAWDGVRYAHLAKDAEERISSSMTRALQDGLHVGATWFEQSADLIEKNRIEVHDAATRRLLDLTDDECIELGEVAARATSRGAFAAASGIDFSDCSDLLILRADHFETRVRCSLKMAGFLLRATRFFHITTPIRLWHFAMSLPRPQLRLDESAKMNRSTAARGAINATEIRRGVVDCGEDYGVKLLETRVKSRKRWQREYDDAISENRRLMRRVSDLERQLAR